MLCDYCKKGEVTLDAPCNFCGTYFGEDYPRDKIHAPKKETVKVHVPKKEKVKEKVKVQTTKKETPEKWDTKKKYY